MIILNYLMRSLSCLAYLPTTVLFLIYTLSCIILHAGARLLLDRHLNELIKLVMFIATFSSNEVVHRVQPIDYIAKPPERGASHDLDFKIRDIDLGAGQKREQAMYICVVSHSSD